MVIIAILKLLLDTKHLDNLRVGILSFHLRICQIFPFLVLSVSSNFSLYYRHLEYSETLDLVQIL